MTCSLCILSPALILARKNVLEPMQILGSVLEAVPSVPVQRALWILVGFAGNWEDKLVLKMSDWFWCRLCPGWFGQLADLTSSTAPKGGVHAAPLTRWGLLHLKHLCSSFEHCLVTKISCWGGLFGLTWFAISCGRILYFCSLQGFSRELRNSLSFLLSLLFLY